MERARPQNYRFRPGEPLSPISIADRLQVGTTPAREALARLHGEDLVDLASNRGFFAKILKVKDMIEHYEFALQISICGIERRHSQFIVDESACKGFSIVNCIEIAKNNAEGCLVSRAKLN
ncbi:GntR family transcriptional regulator [Mesorhizobium sp. M0203]|uniref:GntR family transcriptional regulator n=1 Tax=Mesorhizobium sp. M0203 TaxID=2956912 RepID=UPI00333B0D20